MEKLPNEICVYILIDIAWNLYINKKNVLFNA